MLCICILHFIDSIRNFTKVILIKCNLFLYPNTELMWNTSHAGYHRLGRLFWPGGAPVRPGLWSCELKHSTERHNFLPPFNLGISHSCVRQIFHTLYSPLPRLELCSSVGELPAQLTTIGFSCQLLCRLAVSLWGAGLSLTLFNQHLAEYLAHNNWQINISRTEIVCVQLYRGSCCCIPANRAADNHLPLSKHLCLCSDL